MPFCSAGNERYRLFRSIDKTIWQHAVIIRHESDLNALKITSKRPKNIRFNALKIKRHYTIKKCPENVQKCISIQKLSREESRNIILFNTSFIKIYFWKIYKYIYIYTYRGLMRTFVLIFYIIFVYNKPELVQDKSWR